MSDVLVRLRIVGGAAENWGPVLTDRWLVEYRPLTPEEADAIEAESGPGVEIGVTFTTGGPCPVLIRTTAEKEKALVLEFGEMHALYSQVMPEPFSKRLPDGGENRPLTAYSVEVERIDDAPETKGGEQ